MRIIGLMALLFAGQVFAASANDAKDFVGDLDAAINAAEPALKRGDVKALGEQSKRMGLLKQAGERFGSSVMDKPYGSCFAAGVSAQGWWQAQLDAAKAGKEPAPGRVSGAWKDYRVQRGECLKAAMSGGQAAATEQIASTSETPPRKGCLKVLGVRPDGNVGTVAYTCPKK
ncbi:hypothetical protein LH427_04805 [Laribacter hongkongensis]|uniref:hypothetical protein n=1 Tax=Laribacter hongkongensis TaxID=168471 RepID=UPI001EFE1500|nr:hypothetical protein [Laribacter hongkongensis]MCG8991466.1 hypothetical protein [Laribacter hongkongensis]MCG8997722.1 hypothetical protein [Laribacter hongkongensis]MCG9001252.1 hypothetical protein [Laribacter hongkongensis]MCG9003052.1 hypothetical protein [Laribacter hongkongensis]MCG9007460.1 hypothetical protein [Laribacter hongkongensis]